MGASISQIGEGKLRITASKWHFVFPEPAAQIHLPRAPESFVRRALSLAVPVVSMATVPRVCESLCGG